MKEIDPATIFKFVYYDCSSETFLRWKIDIINSLNKKTKIKKDTVAGSKHHTGYVYVRILGKSLAVHRIIWVLHYGKIENNLFVDHVDGNRENNRIENLRIVDKSINNRNAKKRSDNKSGKKGVHFDEQMKRWVASWSEDGINKRKYFNCSKYGDNAFSFAKRFRDYKIKQMNEKNSAGYTERHIKE